MKQEEKRKKLEDKQARAEAYRVARLEEVKEKAAKQAEAVTKAAAAKKKPELVYRITLTYDAPRDDQNSEQPQTSGRNSAQNSEKKKKEKDGE